MPSAVRRILRWTLLAIALVSVTFIGACVALAVYAGIDNHRRDVNDRAAAAADVRLQRPLVSTSGRVLFVAGSETDDFYVINADGSGLRRLTYLQDKWGHSHTPAVSPDRTRLATTSAGGVLIVRLDRPGETMQLDRPVGWLAWSPDGKQLASLSIDDQKRLHLNVFNADGSGEVRDIATTWPSTADGHQQNVRDLAWSPDGRWFAFVLNTSPRYRSFGPRHTHLYIAPSDGSGLRNMSLEPNALLVQNRLAWSPDGPRLAFEGGRGIAIVDRDLKWTDIPIALNEMRSSQQPAWSPDATRLAWFNPDSIVTSDPDGGRQQELTRGRCRGIHPSWSDDGRRIAFVCYEGRGTVFVMNADGSGLTAIHAGPDNSPLVSAQYQPDYPVWLPAISPSDE